MRTADTETRPTLSAEQLLVENISELRWWALDELLAKGPATTRFAPRRLPELVSALVADGPPNEPLDISD